MQFRLRATAVTSVFLACFASALCFGAAAPPSPWGQVKVDALLPDRRQRDSDCQTRLQQWFMGKIRHYQQVLDDTAIGKATPKIVNLGDWSGFFKTLLAPPTGTGATTITFGTVGAPSTMEDTAEIIFPQGASDAYIDGHPDTCFHEFQHVIVLASERSGRPVAIPRSPWMIYAKPGDNRNEEHIYMEGLAEYTVEWLDLLLHDRSALTGGAAVGFEKHARDAYEQMKQYSARGESLSYAVENFCWAKAHDAYCRAWEQAGKNVAPLPLNFRQDYEQICGVHIGFVEEIIKFYMDGGLKAADGKPIKVPEWVMNPDPMKSAVIVGHLNEGKNISGDLLRFGFDVRVMENYRIKERSDSLNHGKVLIALDNADADTTIELSVDGKPIKRSGASGKVDLAGFKRTGTIRVTLVRNKLSSFRGVRRYHISVQYEPDPRMVDGVQKPPFYLSSKAVYYVDVTGSGKASVPAPPATSAPGASSAAAPKTPKGAWRLDGVVKGKKFDDFLSNQNITGDAAVDDTTAEISAQQNIDGRPPRIVKWHRVHTWTHPGTTLTPDTKVPVTITVTQDGDMGGPWTTLEAWVEPPAGHVSFGLFDHPTSGGKDSSGGSASLDQTKSTESKTIQMPIPEGRPGDKLIVRFKTLSSPMTVEVDFRYVWEPIASDSSPGKADATLVAEEPQPEPEPPGMDNVPPGPGEVVKIPVTKETPPPTKPDKPKSPEQWYTHPSGDYKFKVSPGWKVFAKQFFDEKDAGYDTLFPSDEGMAVICARDFTDNGSKTADTVLNNFAAKMLKDRPSAQSARVKFGMAEAVQIADWDKDTGVMTWNIGVFHKGRSYFISVAMPSESKPARIPDPPAWMLGSLVTMR